MKVSISTENGSAREELVKTELEGLLKQYNVEKYSFTDKVIIEEGVIPHSHPVITLNTRRYEIPERTLTTYIHEQLHHYFEDHKGHEQSAIKILEEKYPSVPVGFPDGARDEYSTRLHLLLCTLEFKAAKDLFGSEKADELMGYWKQNYYRWIFETVDKDYEELAASSKNTTFISNWSSMHDLI